MKDQRLKMNGEMINELDNGHMIPQTEALLIPKL